MIRRTLLLAFITLVVSAAPAAAATPQQVLRDRSSTGLALMTAYSDLLVTKNTRALGRMISPAFIIQRTDGSWAGRKGYLRRLPDLRGFTFADTVERRHGRILTVRMTATSVLFINGAEYRPEPAPLMGVWQWQDNRWQLVAQGNFNLPRG
jgi:hypothetical protein